MSLIVERALTRPSHASTHYLVIIFTYECSDYIYVGYVQLLSDNRCKLDKLALYANLNFSPYR